MRGFRPLLLALVASGLLAGCLYRDPSPEEALPSEDFEPVDGFDLMREIRAVNQGLDSSSPPSYLELARARLANLTERVNATEANGTLSPEDAAAARAAIAEEQDSLFWIGVTADARRDPEGSFALAENKTAQGEARLANATDFADMGKARSDLLHAQAILVALGVYHPGTIAATRFDALEARVEADLAQTEAWTPASTTPPG